MPLQSSGPISISQIRTELGSASASLRALSSLAGFSTPDAMSEFYGYSNNPTLVLGLGPEYNDAYATCSSPISVSQNVTYTGTLGISTYINGISVSGNSGYFLIVQDSSGQNTLSTIGIDDNNEVIYLEFICSF